MVEFIAKILPLLLIVPGGILLFLKLGVELTLLGLAMVALGVIIGWYSQHKSLKSGETTRSGPGGIFIKKK